LLASGGHNAVILSLAVDSCFDPTTFDNDDRDGMIRLGGGMTKAAKQQGTKKERD
jgi:hypothetical protein